VIGTSTAGAGHVPSAGAQAVSPPPHVVPSQNPRPVPHRSPPSQAMQAPQAQVQSQMKAQTQGQTQAQAQQAQLATQGLSALANALPPPPTSFARRRAGQLGMRNKPADIVISPREAEADGSGNSNNTSNPGAGGAGPGQLRGVRQFTFEGQKAERGGGMALYLRRRLYEMSMKCIVEVSRIRVRGGKGLRSKAMQTKRGRESC